MGAPPEAGEGSYFHGLCIEGAHWDMEAGELVDATPKVLSSATPVMLVQGIFTGDAEAAGHTPAAAEEATQQYECPVYMTAQRGDTYVFTAHLATNLPQRKWTLAGVALLMSIDA